MINCLCGIAAVLWAHFISLNFGEQKSIKFKLKPAVFGALLPVWRESFQWLNTISI